MFCPKLVVILLATLFVAPAFSVPILAPITLAPPTIAPMVIESPESAGTNDSAILQSPIRKSGINWITCIDMKTLVPTHLNNILRIAETAAVTKDILQLWAKLLASPEVRDLIEDVTKIAASNRSKELSPNFKLVVKDTESIVLARRAIKVAASPNGKALVANFAKFVTASEVKGIDLIDIIAYRLATSVDAGPSTIGNLYQSYALNRTQIKSFLETDEAKLLDESINTLFSSPEVEAMLEDINKIVKIGDVANLLESLEGVFSTPEGKLFQKVLSLAITSDGKALIANIVKLAVKLMPSVQDLIDAFANALPENIYQLCGDMISGSLTLKVPDYSQHKSLLAD